MAKINSKKYEEVILYLISKLGGEIRGKKKLAKLLYFVDFDFFENREGYLTRETYKALPMGPYPIHMENITKNLKDDGRLEINQIEEKNGYNPTEIYRTSSDIKVPEFNDDELKILDRVITKYGNLTGKQLEDLTHNEAPHIGTEPNEVIAYELSFYRGTDFSEGA